MSNLVIGDALAVVPTSPRQWVPHSERMFSVPGLLASEECAALIELAEQRGFDAASVRTVAGPQLMRNVRNNERAQFEAPSWIALLWERAAALLLPPTAYEWRSCRGVGDLITASKKLFFILKAEVAANSHVSI